ncbi:MAG: BatD family protein, partial [Candidatus Omnitrophota bacterium]|nr:BatD family protein [Candidatus Omnitrophota bacterium]
APDIGNIAGLEIRYLGPSTMMTVISGKVSSSITHMYSILPLKIGKFELGPFSFTFKGNSYTSNTAFLEVVEERIAPREKKEEASLEKLNLEDRLFLTLDAGKTRAYVNELVPVTVKLYVNRLNVSDIQLPTFEQESFSKVEFKEPKQYKERLGGLIYDVLEFKTNIFGAKPGDFRLGPAKVKCNVAIKRKAPRAPSGIDDFFEDDLSRDSFFDDFFTRYERYPIELKSQDVQLMISPLPAAGRPSDFSGAVGDYQFIFSASPSKVKVGDPITLSMDINGTGNFNTILLPKLENTEGFKVYEPQVKTEANRKNFRLVLIPESADITQTPSAAFSYFDTNNKVYRTISQGPLPIQVEKGK